MKNLETNFIAICQLLNGPRRTKQDLEQVLMCNFESIRPVAEALFRLGLITYDKATGQFWEPGVRELVDLFQGQQALTPEEISAHSGYSLEFAKSRIQLAVKNGYLEVTADNRYRVKMPDESAISPGI